jgi:SAM-dependent MidA family methyltransferase
VSPFEALAERVHRLGPVPFDAFVELALYHPEGGFFTSGGGAGRRGDFITSPEVGHLFGAVVARALDSWWTEMGRPDPVVVVEAGAGRGALARAVLDAAPECLPALRYVCVERSAALREAQADLLPIEPAANVFGPAVDDDPDDDRPGPLANSGPVVTALDDLPATHVTGVILANELLDNLPFRLAERTGSGWSEVRVGIAGEGGARAPVEVLVEAPQTLAAEAGRLAPDAPVGARIPLQHGATAWLRRALELVHRGRLVVADYADETPALAARPWREWLRTYRGHERGDGPLDAMGAQDITCEVAVDQLARVRPPDHDRTQAGFLAAHGIDELVEAARSTWTERAHLGDLEALKARSRVTEAAALTDPTGLGAFRVLEWEIG